MNGARVGTILITAYSHSRSPSCTLGPARASLSCLPSTRHSRAMPAPLTTGSVARPEVQPRHPIVGEQAVGGAGQNDTPLVEDAAPVADGQRLAGALLDHQHGDLLGRQLDDQLEDLLPENIGERSKPSSKIS